MFLKNLSHASRKIGFRLSGGFTLLFLISSAAVGVILFFLLAGSLARRDREIVEARLKQYVTAYEAAGVEGLKGALNDRKNGVDGSKLLVRLQDARGKLLFYHFPEKTPDFNPEAVERQLAKQNVDERWFRIVAPEDREDALEVLAQEFSDGRRIQVGKDTDDREETLDGFKLSFFIVIAPCALIGMLAGLLFSRRSLSPVRGIINTIRSIEAGHAGARVPLRQNGDELDELASLFNNMLEKNERLIVGLHESLDLVAHDLRTPMTRLKNLAERGLRSPGLHEKEEALIECIESSDQIITLLNATMDVSEADAGGIKLKLMPIALEQLLSEVIDVYAIVAEERGIGLSMRAEAIVFNGDYRLKQALANLLDNAIKYSPSGKKIFLAAYRSGANAMIEVHDQGPGISEREAGQIWARLYRGDHSRSTEGLGLGLSIVKSIVNAHGGTVLVEAGADAGSVFRIVLPVRDASLPIRNDSPLDC